MEASKLLVGCLHQHLIWKLRPVIAVTHKIQYRVMVTGISLLLLQGLKKPNKPVTCKLVTSDLIFPTVTITNGAAQEQLE